uniref:Uncharacterized protein n=1 Tax=Ditylenchus dipsaci TaxID=166011 RepID=A0A915DPG3_9BILA
MALSCLKLDELSRSPWRNNLRSNPSDHYKSKSTKVLRETAGDECLGVAANSRDLFVYLNPHKANASVSLNLVRSKAKKMISNSTSDLDKKPTKQISLDSGTSSSSPNHQSRSVSSQQLNGKTVSSSDLLHAKFNQLKKTQPLSEEDLSDSLTSSTLTYAIDGIGSCRILPKFPRDSPPLSVHQEEEVESQQLQSTSQQIIGKMENNKSTTSSKLADKLSKSFFDLTQGSQDRLQKWKSKLQKQCSQHNNHHHQRSLRGEGREKDTSEPPPRNRKMCTLGGAVPASSEMEILVDWTTSKPIIGESEQESAYSRHPRPLRSTHSASNAMNLVNKLSSPASSDNGLKPANNKILTSITSTANPLHKSNSLREPYTIRSPAANVNSPVSSPASNYSSATMEHRTLRQREQQQQFNDTAAATIGSTACKNFQQLLQSIEGYSAKNSYPPPDRQNRNSGELPPPARIMPFSGIKPQDNGIIHRPIAFRPVANGQNGSSNGNVLEHRQSVGQKGVSSNIEHHKQTLKDHSRSIGNLVSATVTAPSRPGNNTNSNRSSALQNASTSHSASSSHLYNSDHPPAKPTAQHQQNGHHNNLKVGNEENDYDTVPEFVDHKCFSEGDSIGNNSETYSLIYPYQNTTNNISGKPLVGLVNEGNKRGSMFQTGNSSSTNNHSSAMIHSPIASKKLVNGSQQQQQSYRHSSGVHITPSPSDSGIVDYETLIRDKENELSTVRHAMEQNEEVLIRVYQEKERQFKEQISNLKQKLQDTNSTSPLYTSNCECSATKVPEDGEGAGFATVDGSVYENGGGIADKHRPPVPAPRTFKDANGPNQELRSEVDDLRGEICNLRDQLNNQIHFFTDERRRWEQERQQQNSQHTSPPADVLPNVVSKSSSKPTPLSALYGAPYTKRGEVIMSTDRLI